VRAAAATYVVPDDENYVQPTVTADRGRVHLEGRFNYEDRNSLSGFVGRNFEVGDRLTLELTPMLGGVAGDTSGLVPGLELTLAFRWLELYSEGEYVIDLAHPMRRYLYNWSELTVSPAEWLRAGLATQRTRAVRRPRDLQRGAMVGATVGRFDATVYYFNPGTNDHYVVVSAAVTF
jgi:hypothetical protein